MVGVSSSSTIIGPFDLLDITIPLTDPHSISAFSRFDLGNIVLLRFKALPTGGVKIGLPGLLAASAALAGPGWTVDVRACLQLVENA